MTLIINLFKNPIPQILLFLTIAINLRAQETVPLEFDEAIFIYKGTKTFDEKVLASQTGVNESEIYNKFIVGEAVTKLEKFYFDNGFFNAIIDTTIRINKEDENVTVKFIIKENDRFRIDSLSYIGLDLISPDASKKLKRIKTIKAGDFYNKVLIIQQTNEIVDMLQNNGYMNARLKTDSGTLIRKYDLQDAKSASVLISFEGADTIFYFGNTSIVIDENVYNVSTELLNKEIAYMPGEMYDKRKKLESERGITKIAIIQSTRIEASSFNGTKVDFEAKVKLNKKNEIVPYIEGANIENYFFIGGGARYIDKYFLGGGRVLTMELDGLFNSIKINRFEFSTTLTQPYFINKKTVLSDKITIGLYNLEKTKNYYLGNLTTLSYFISTSTFYNNLFLDLNEELVRFKFDEDSTNLLTLFHSFLGATAVHDRTNDVLSPTKGLYHSITGGSAGLLPKLIVNSFSNLYYSQFFKVSTINRFYWNLSSLATATIFATSFKAGDIIEYGSGNRLIPVQPIYKFFSGGSSSLRGWNAKENGILDDKLEGGKFLLEGSLELRKRLFPDANNFRKNIKAAFFIDYGNVWVSHKDFRLDQIALAIGFGLRYDLFVGPIRIDFGFKLYDPLDSANEKWLFSNFNRIFKDKFAIHFGIGESF